MEKYIYISNTNKKESLAISSRVLEKIAEDSIKTVPGVFTKESESLKGKKAFKFHKPVEATINHGIVHIKIYVDVLKGVSIQEISLSIQERIKDDFFQTVETIPFDIQVYTETII